MLLTINQKHILKFQVTMDKSVGVTVVHGLSDLFDEDFSCLFI